MQRHFRASPPLVHRRALTLERVGLIRCPPGSMALAALKWLSMRYTVGLELGGVLRPPRIALGRSMLPAFTGAQLNYE
jgi:hypothetical protein